MSKERWFLLAVICAAVWLVLWYVQHVSVVGLLFASGLFTGLGFQANQLIQCHKRIYSLRMRIQDMTSLLGSAADKIVAQDQALHPKDQVSP